jgi:hypothetical protein
MLYYGEKRCSIPRYFNLMSELLKSNKITKRKICFFGFLKEETSKKDGRKPIFLMLITLKAAKRRRLQK